MILGFVILTVTVLAVDLITKFTIPGILNPGISWGMGANIPWLWIVVVFMSFIIAIAAIVYFIKSKKKSKIMMVGLSLFVGGVLGNAIDRLLSDGSVHDFINFVIFQNNIADIAIIAGAILVGVKIAFR